MPLLDLVQSAISAGAGTALSVFLLRALPPLVALFASPDCPRSHKAAALGVYLIAGLVAVHALDFDLQSLVLAYVALCLLSLVPYALAPFCSRPVLFGLALGVSFVLPSLYEHPHIVLVLVIGWELALGAYSYGVDAPPRVRSLEHYWFFLFVDPTLAYPCRATLKGPARLHAGGALRGALGLLALTASGAVSASGSALFASAPAFGGVVISALDVVAVYAAQSGLASLQIGLARQLGYEAPECYLRPYLALTPREFWARWNTYVGNWARLYVFKPIVRAFARTRTGGATRTRAWTRALAVLPSFLVVGALHDLYTTLGEHQPTVSLTLWFGANAVLLLAWEGLITLRRRGHGERGRLRERMLAVTAMVGVATAFVVLP